MIRTGDCLAVMPELEAESVDAIVTDPPYGLEFMGKEWDSFRVDPRAARWASRSGSAGHIQHSDLLGASLPVYTKRRTTSTCLTCGKRDAFRNPHKCGDATKWRTIPVDTVNVELRAYQEWTTRWAAEAYRIAKPGAWMLAFGGTRTYHRLAAGVEDAGWEIRDCLVWAYAQGFPKSLNVGQAIDARLGRQSAVVGERTLAGTAASGFPKVGNLDGGPSGIGASRVVPILEPVTVEGRRFADFGTALKPAWEPILLARKPLIGSVAENMLELGTGALNVGAGRLEYEAQAAALEPSGFVQAGLFGDDAPVELLEAPADPRGDLGRWPANVMLTDPVFDAETPEVFTSEPPGAIGGSYTRFFLVPKAGTAEREPQFGELEARPRQGRYGSVQDGEPIVEDGRVVSRRLDYTYDRAPRRNHHPTVKPLELMRHLVRIVAPPGGLILDPFLGSGTTAIAAEMEGFGWAGIERDPEYAAIAEARLLGVQKGLGLR